MPGGRSRPGRRLGPLRGSASSLVQERHHGFPPISTLLSMLPCRAMSLESDLYAPVKTLVEQRVDILLDPAPYTPRKDKRRVGRLLGEHARRVGDPNRGGSSTRVPLMTAYRQQALRCAGLLAANGPMKVAALKLAADAPKAAAILKADHYGWFERIERGIYGLTPQGRAGLEQHGWKA